VAQAFSCHSDRSQNTASLKAGKGMSDEMSDEN